MQIKVLSLGDAYSAGAQRYLAKIAKCDGVEITLGNLMMPDATLEKHCAAVRDDLPAYRFDYTPEGSVRLNTIESCLPSRAFAWLDWDYITMQQSAELAGDAASFLPYAGELAFLMKQRCPDALPVLNETWAFEPDCREEAFARYHRDPDIMANMIHNACLNAAENADIHIVFPLVEAFRAAKSNLPDTPLTVDGCHGNRLGDFLAGAVWYEILTGNDMSKNAYRLPFVPTEQVDLLKKTAHEVASQYSLKKTR